MGVTGIMRGHASFVAPPPKIIQFSDLVFESIVDKLLDGFGLVFELHF